MSQKYSSKKEVQQALKEARKFLVQANRANNRILIQQWLEVCDKLRDLEANWK